MLDSGSQFLHDADFTHPSQVTEMSRVRLPANRNKPQPQRGHVTKRDLGENPDLPEKEKWKRFPASTEAGWVGMGIKQSGCGVGER